MEGMQQDGQTKWTMYDCRDGSNNKFSSFTNFFEFVGAEKEYEVTQKPGKPNPKGGTYAPTFTLSLPKQGSRVQANTDALYEKMFTKLNSIEKKIDDLVASFEPSADEPEDVEPPLENEPPF